MKKVGLSQPATRATGSKIVKTKRGIGGRMVDICIYGCGDVGYVIESEDAMGEGIDYSKSAD